MDPKTFSEKSIKTAGTTKITIKKTFCSPLYGIEEFSDERATKSGWVKVARVAPLKPKKGLPEFYFRWDDAGDELDVDIHLDGKKRRDLWLVAGYSGHKPKLINGSERKYESDIRIPSGIVFQGGIEVGLQTDLMIADEVHVSEGKPIIKIVG